MLVIPHISLSPRSTICIVNTVVKNIFIRIYEEGTRGFGSVRILSMGVGSVPNNAMLFVKFV